MSFLLIFLRISIVGSDIHCLVGRIGPVRGCFARRLHSSVRAHRAREAGGAGCVPGCGLWYMRTASSSGKGLGHNDKHGIGVGAPENAQYFFKNYEIFS